MPPVSPCTRALVAWRLVSFGAMFCLWQKGDLRRRNFASSADCQWFHKGNSKQVEAGPRPQSSTDDAIEQSLSSVGSGGREESIILNPSSTTSSTSAETNVANPSPPSTSAGTTSVDEKITTRTHSVSSSGATESTDSSMSRTTDRSNSKQDTGASSSSSTHTKAEPEVQVPEDAVTATSTVAPVALGDVLTSGGTIVGAHSASALKAHRVQP
ncbi:unnamed protein product [Amoebophrya sp. A25]|nr:unnamed protein product [Amoebophrya sp. A25]|eukprot:GSA25T00007188001.1